MRRHWIAALFVSSVLFVGLRAQQPFDTRVPTDLIAYRNATTCWTAWTELTAARGAVLVGLVSGGTKGVMVGTALTDQENRNHTHTLNAHLHSWSDTPSGPSATTTMSDTPEGNNISDSVHTHPAESDNTDTNSVNTGTQSAMVTPYLQLLICRKT